MNCEGLSEKRVADFTRNGKTGTVADERDILLTPLQIENVKHLIILSDRFARRAGIQNPLPEKITPDTIVIESGHQPNFLPYCGTWKKAFFLDRIQRKLAQEEQVVAFFCLADRNLSTARLLYRNHVPALNKNGSETIGFGIADHEKFKSFDSCNKPRREAWQNEIDRICEHYRVLAKQSGSDIGEVQFRLDRVMEILHNSYKKSHSFAELNCIIFAQICRELFGLDIRFYLNSEVELNHLFLVESRRLLEDLPTYTRVFNRVVQERNLNIRPALPANLPFWYHCSCGSKLPIIVDESMTSKIVCPACNEEHHLSFGQDFGSLPDYYHNMDFHAVSRDLIVSEGLGSSLFLSGVGGSLVYGEISNRIAPHLGFRRPLVISWRSSDYYLGMAHFIAFTKLADLSGCSRESGPAIIHEKILETIRNQTEELSRAESEGAADKSVILSLKNQIRLRTNIMTTAKGVFSPNCSMLDVLVNNGSEAMTSEWDTVLFRALPTKQDHGIRLDADILYPSGFPHHIQTGSIPEIFTSMQNPGGS